MKKRIILMALISFITMSFTAKSQTTFDTKNCQFKIVINKNELFFVSATNFTPPPPVTAKVVNKAFNNIEMPAIKKVSCAITFNNGVYNNISKNADWSATKTKTVAEMYLLDEKGKTIKHWTITNATFASVKCSNKTAAVVKIDSMMICGDLTTD